LAFSLVALGLPVAQLLGMIDWSWWIVAAPMWLICMVVLGGWELVERLLFPFPPR
jgi:hypothetical protein